jgi:hypothetical protein
MPRVGFAIINFTEKLIKNIIILKLQLWVLQDSTNLISIMIIHTYHSCFIPEWVSEASSYSSETPTFCQNY